ncbi:tRNA wybutosine-synthesizing protein 3 homolog isoform X2 [Bombina bombina]|nr:tRNA wybutosine-synthesizing protein 3 homolog isoform X2 [Bombina bombina]
METVRIFKHWKTQSLNKIDFSKKGSVDEDIEDIVRIINQQDCYFTTSSCSGRVIVIDESSDLSAIQKQNCSWLFVTHQLCNSDNVFAALQEATGDAVMKFEAFVLHVQCRMLEDAQLLHNVAINSGFRNSGITVGKKGKIVMAVRSTHCLEVPLSHRGKCLVDKDYIEFLVHTANHKMEENKTRIARFYSCLQSALQKGECVRDEPCKEQTSSSVYTRRRRRKEEIINSDCSLVGEVDDPEADLALFNDDH